MSSPTGSGGAAAASNSQQQANAKLSPVECPELVRVKYPFITCSMDAHGNVLMNSMGAPLDGERLPKQGSYADEGDGHWGAMR